MKRIWTLVLSLVFILLFTACGQPAPVKAVEAIKDSDRLIENAVDNAGEGAGHSNEKGQSENPDTPGTSHSQDEGINDKPEIKTDAAASGAGNGKVLAGKYGIPERYKFETEGAGGKLKIAVDARVTVPDKNSMPIYRVKQTEFKKETIDAFYKALCGDAEMSGQIYDNYIYTNEYTDKGKDGIGRRFQFENKSVLYMDFRNPGGGVNFGSSPSLPVYEDADVGAEVLAKIGLTPGEARQKVQDLLDKTVSGMVVNGIYLQDDEQFGNYDGIVRPAEQYAYKVFCVRSVDGLPCSYIMGGSNTGKGKEGKPAEGSQYWMYEELEIMINKEGIFEISWHSPVEVTGKVNKETKLKPFSDIREVFEKVMCVKYEPEAELHGGLDFEIGLVALSLQRIVEKNSNESGLLIPAWNFYGKLKVESSDSGHFEKIGESFMTINAIDGSVIDAQKGY